MHPEVYDWVAKHIGEPERVIELGSLDVNGTIRDLFDCDYVGVDIVPGPNVDVVADAATVTLPPADVVICCEVLEHTPKPAEIIHNAYKLLKPGGRLILTCASLGRAPHGQHGSAFPAEGEHYENITDDDVRLWLSDFTTKWVTRRRGGVDLYALAEK